MPRLFTYIVRHDTGLAPNPFWGWCTLAVCTPNHQGSRVQAGDWIAGFSEKRLGYRLIYAMEVEERIHMNDYFADPRFAPKKPRPDGTWEQRCGDNFYSLDPGGVWRQHPNELHVGAEFLRRDTKHPFVFAGRRFWYLGSKAAPIPTELLPLVGGRGARVNHSPDLVAAFVGWVEKTLPLGGAAPPRDADRPGCAPRAAIVERGRSASVRGC
jgi:hypothetical protein